MSTKDLNGCFFIESAPCPEPTWTEQVRAIRATGAEFGGKKRWFLEVNSEAIPHDTLNELLAIASRYGTTIKYHVAHHGEPQRPPEK